jgi:large subunit ribosomal protein L17
MHRHQYKGRKLGREAGPRKALVRSLTTSVILHERVTTTWAKAKETAPYVDRMITLAKNGSLPAQRRLGAFIYDSGAIKKLMQETVEVYKDRAGGYTRVVHLGPRLGDGAEMAILELVDYKPAVKKPKKVKEAASDQSKIVDDPKTEVSKAPTAEKKASPKAKKQPAKPKKEENTEAVQS